MIDYKAMRISMPSVAEDVVIRDPIVFDDPDFANGEPTLSRDEVAFFKENGFIVKRGLLEDRGNFKRIVDYMWENVPRQIIRREDPQTWPGAPHGQWTEEDVEKAGLFSGGAWKMRSQNGIGTEPFLLDKIAHHPNMLKVVSSFIGGPIKRCGRVRGVYGVFPVPPGVPGKLSPHADHTAAMLSAMVIVDEVPPHCGGFTVWPGSHHVVHPHCSSTHGPVKADRAQAYALARDQALRDITPVELSGRAGDVIFWHPRLLHSGGNNLSAGSDRPILRVIVPCDYQRDGLDFFDDPIEGPGPNHQWWVDTRNFHSDGLPTAANIWDGWVFG
ncbi:MAG: phytanoyl-CoA dioxygenase family protein [bacterium]|nr:phytanoyl-CoA dioxygenase family protein [bacterium]